MREFCRLSGQHERGPKVGVWSGAADFTLGLALGLEFSAIAIQIAQFNSQTSQIP